MDTTSKIRDFTDLKVWQKAHKLTLSVYSSTQNYPKEEGFGLTSQIRRASVSVTSNIAEGFGRKQPKDKQHFYNMALASLYELRNQLILSRDLDYISAEDFDRINMLAIESQKMLFIFIKKTGTIK